MISMSMTGNSLPKENTQWSRHGTWEQRGGRQSGAGLPLDLGPSAPYFTSPSDTTRTILPAFKPTTCKPFSRCKLSQAALPEKPLCSVVYFSIQPTEQTWILNQPWHVLCLHSGYI